MSPILAAVLYVAFIIWLIRVDSRDRPPLEPALWVPFIWLLILGSRPLSFWLTGSYSASTGAEEGSFIDRNFYLVLTMICIVILQRAGTDWGKILTNNPILVLFYLYLLVSCFWSEYPFASFKRWFKDLSAIFVGLVILSRSDPREAIESIGSKCAIILFTLSVLFLKYYPEFGRRYTISGVMEVTGVTDQKNSLGAIVVVFGLLVVSSALSRFASNPKLSFWKGASIPLVIVGIGLWLVWRADSKTSMVCLAAGLCVLFSHKIPIIGANPKRFLIFCIIGVALYTAADQLFALRDASFQMLGRDSTLTGRTAIWDVVKQNPVDPLFGSGYLAYWDLHNPVFIGKTWMYLKTAHNGYLETYLDGGWIGVCVLALLLVVTGIRIGRAFAAGSAFAKLQLAFYIVILIHNLTESTFARRSPFWFAFLLFCSNFIGVFAREREAETETQPLEDLTVPPRIQLP